MQDRPAHDMGWNVNEKGISVGRVAPPSHSLDCTLPFSVLRTDEDGCNQRHHNQAAGLNLRGAAKAKNHR